MPSETQDHEIISVFEEKNQTNELISLPSNVYVMKCHHQQGRTLHRHKCFEMFYVLSGTSGHTLSFANGKTETQTLSAGNYCILDRSVGHSFENVSSDFHLVNFLFSPSLFRKDYKDDISGETLLLSDEIGIPSEQIDINIFNHPHNDANGAVLTLFEKAWKAYSAKDFCFRTLLRCYAVEILILAVRGNNLSAISPRKNHIINYICNYVNSNYADNISLTRICKAQYLNSSFISRKFKESMGMTFESYLQQVRIRNAATQLMETDLSVEEIGNRSGYADTASFRKIFKRLLGVSPTEFRRRNQ